MEHLVRVRLLHTAAVKLEHLELTAHETPILAVDATGRNAAGPATSAIAILDLEWPYATPRALSLPRHAATLVALEWPPASHASRLLAAVSNRGALRVYDVGAE